MVAACSGTHFPPRADNSDVDRCVPSSLSSRCRTRIAGWGLVRTHAADAARALPSPAPPRPLGASLLAGAAPPDGRGLLGAIASRSRVGGPPCRSVGRTPPAHRAPRRSRRARREGAAPRHRARGRLAVSELVRLRALGRPVVSRTDATTIRELRRLGGLLKKVHVDSGGAYSQQTAAALATLQAAIARLAAATEASRDRQEGADVEDGARPRARPSTCARWSTTSPGPRPAATARRSSTEGPRTCSTSTTRPRSRR